MKRVLLAALALSAAGFVGITSYEGFRGAAYEDSAAVTTVGFGTTRGVQPGDTITVERALVRTLEDAGEVERAIKNCVAVPLHQHEFDAYVSLAYNIGASAFCGSTLVRKLNAQDYAGACAEISRWNKEHRRGADGSFEKRVSRGLTNRRAAERALCEGG